MPINVEEYLADGCGRCELGGTDQCKVRTWPDALTLARQILLETELQEEIKWGSPCYTYNGQNVLMLSALRKNVTIGFFKGALLKDAESVLSSPGPNSQAARQFVFTSAEQITELADTIKAYVAEAIEIEKSGRKIEFKDVSDYDIPDELQQKFDTDPAFKTAFEALTPGRQKGYILNISAAKQSKTRAARIEKFLPRIFEGLGLHDR